MINLFFTRKQRVVFGQIFSALTYIFKVVENNNISNEEKIEKIKIVYLDVPTTLAMNKTKELLEN